MVWLDVKTTLARDADGEPIGIIGVSKDATARKQAEDALMKSERLYRLISQASREALWEWELETGKVSWSPGAEAILGMDPQTLDTNGALAAGSMPTTAAGSSKDWRTPSPATACSGRTSTG